MWRKDYLLNANVIVLYQDIQLGINKTIGSLSGSLFLRNWPVSIRSLFNFFYIVVWKLLFLSVNQNEKIIMCTTSLSLDLGVSVYDAIQIMNKGPAKYRKIRLANGHKAKMLQYITDIKLHDSLESHWPRYKKQTDRQKLEWPYRNFHFQKENILRNFRLLV